MLNIRTLTVQILSAPRRFMRRRGFGVHSPFAFAFLSNAIREQDAYYAYESINALTPKRSLRKFLRLAFRTAVVLKAKRVAVFGPDSNLLLKALEYAGAKQSSNPLLVVATADANHAVALECVRSGGTVILGNIHKNKANALLIKTIAETCGHGMTFTNGETAIFVARPNLPKQTFRITL